MMRHLDRGSLIVILITFVLFVGALFAKGLSHDLLLEAGVFLISVKLIIMAYKHSVSTHRLLQSLEEMRRAMSRLESGENAGKTNTSNRSLQPTAGRSDV
jgi:HAMP domain-containing protein